MKPLLFLTLMLMFSMVPSYAVQTGQAVEVLATCDAWAIESAWSSHTSVLLGLELRHESGIGLRVPLSLTLDRSGGGEALFETAVKLSFLPWATGPFISISLAQVAMFIGPYVPADRIHYLQEIAFGYSWEFLPGWFVQPTVIYRDPSSGFDESYAYLQGLVPSYQKFRFCLDIGWKFATILPEGNGR